MSYPIKHPPVTKRTHWQKNVLAILDAQGNICQAKILAEPKDSKKLRIMAEEQMFLFIPIGLARRILPPWEVDKMDFILHFERPPEYHKIIIGWEVWKKNLDKKDFEEKKQEILKQVVQFYKEKENGLNWNR